VFEPSQRFVGDTALKRRIVSHSKPEKRPVPRSVNGTFICIDLKLETPFNETGQIFHDPSASLFAAHVDVAIIRVTHESVATAFKLTIQLIQHEIREQGRERATLRGPFPTVLEYPLLSTPAVKKLRMSRSNRRSATRAATAAIKRSWFTGQRTWPDQYPRRTIAFDDIGLRLRHRLCAERPGRKP